jgi:hypothetical protein
MQNQIEQKKVKLIQKINLETFILVISTFIYTVSNAYELFLIKSVSEYNPNANLIISSLIIGFIFFYWTNSRYEFFLHNNKNDSEQKTYRKTPFSAAISRFVPIIGVYFGYVITQEIVNNKSGVVDNKIMWLLHIQCLGYLLLFFSNNITFSISSLVIDFICGTWAVWICYQTQLKLIQKVQHN